MVKLVCLSLLAKSFSSREDSRTGSGIAYWWICDRRHLEHRRFRNGSKQTGLKKVVFKAGLIDPPATSHRISFSQFDAQPGAGGMAPKKLRKGASWLAKRGLLSGVSGLSCDGRSLRVVPRTFTPKQCRCSKWGPKLSFTVFLRFSSHGNS